MPNLVRTSLKGDCEKSKVSNVTDKQTQTNSRKKEREGKTFGLKKLKHKKLINKKKAVCGHHIL